MKEGYEMSDEARRRMSEAATKRWSSEEERRKQSDRLFGRGPSEEVRQQISLTLKGRVISQETRQKISDTLSGHPVSEETRRKMSESHIGIRLSKETKQRISDAVTGQVHSEEEERNRSESMKANWRDPEFVKRMAEAFGMKPNETELQLQSVLDAYFPGEWEYVGDGQVVLGGRIPDFINVNGKKQIIEVFGVYWHDPDIFPNRPSAEELIAHYRQFGFDCLVLWEYDVWNGVEVSNRIREYFSRSKEAGDESQ